MHFVGVALGLFFLECALFPAQFELWLRLRNKLVAREIRRANLCHKVER